MFLPTYILDRSCYLQYQLQVVGHTFFITGDADFVTFFVFMENAPKKSSSVHPKHARALTVGRYGRYGIPKKSSSIHPKHARALTVGQYGRYGKPNKSSSDHPIYARVLTVGRSVR